MRAYPRCHTCGVVVNDGARFCRRHVDLVANLAGANEEARRLARERVLEVLLATREGRTAEVIAFDLGVARRTVERHRARLRAEGRL